MNEMAQRIRDLYERDAANPRNAISRDELPFSYECVTPEWLTDVLCREHPGARVIDVSLDVKDEGTAQRQRIFLRYNTAGEAAGLPAAVFCKATHSLVHRINLGLSGGTHSEVTFYNHIRPHIEGDVPTAYFAAYDPDSFNSIIIMPDMAGEVEFCRHWTPISFAQISSQLDLLAGMHAKFLDNPRLNASTLGMVTWPSFFEAVVSYGHEDATNAGFLAAQQVIPERLYKRFPEIWPSIVYVNETHKSLPATLLHGDCHLKQWYIRKSTGGLGLTDWQCASFGHWARDLAYMTVTSLAIEDRRAWEMDLIRYYMDQMKARGVAMPGFDEVLFRYRQNLVQAMSWWTGTLTPTEDQPDMQPRDTSLEFIKRFAHAIDDLDALEACKG